MATVEDITASLAAAHKSPQDWGIVQDTAVDEQFAQDIREIREAEVAAERNASTLRVF